MLDELLATGAVICRGKKNWVKMTAWWHCIYRNSCRIVHSRRSGSGESFGAATAIVAVLADGGAWFAQQISQRYATKSANRLISLPCKRRYGPGLARRHHQRHLGTVTRPHPSSSNARTSTRRSHRARRGRPSMRNPSRRWYLTTHQIWLDVVVIAGGATKRYRKDAGAGGNMLDRYGIISRQAVIAENIPAGFHRCKRFVEVWKTPGELSRSFCRRSGWRAIR